MKWVKVDFPLPDSDLVTQIKVDGKKLCLIKHNQHVYVIQNSCPHAGGILSGGWCKENHIVCPIHRYEYDLSTGRGAPGQGDYIHIYPTEWRNNELYVGFKESLWKRFFG